MELYIVLILSAYCIIEGLWIAFVTDGIELCLRKNLRLIKYFCASASGIYAIRISVYHKFDHIDLIWLSTIALFILPSTIFRFWPWIDRRVNT